MHESRSGERTLFHGSPDIALIIFPRSSFGLNLNSIVVGELNAIFFFSRTSPLEAKVKALVQVAWAGVSWYLWRR